ncbi:MAG: peptidoglycan-binding protein [Clostridiales bacterium]|nr:peptidoglycan-binding protein [Clostridiales bacterium]
MRAGKPSVPLQIPPASGGDSISRSRRRYRKKGIGCGGILIIIIVCAILSLIGRGIDSSEPPSQSSRATATQHGVSNPNSLVGSRGAVPSDNGRQGNQLNKEQQTIIEVTNSPSVTAGIGSNGASVQQIQTKLASMGYFNDSVSGDYTYSTVQAVNAFQKTNRLPVTGEVDEVTSQCLFSSIAIPAPTILVTATPTTKPGNKSGSAKSSGQDYRDSGSKGTTYVLNTSSRKFHLPWCSSVKSIKPKNYKEYTGTRDEVISMGYDACQKCYP